MPTVAIIGAGQIGFAAARAFRERGWETTIYARSKPAWHEPLLYRFSNYMAGEDSPPFADVVVDTIAYDADDVARYDPDTVGRLIAISSASVYCDDQGRTLDEGAINGYPEFDAPITEEQSKVAPGPETYSVKKVRMEQKAIELFGERAAILRPCAIYGPHSRHPREWWFVKRMLDGRARIPLAFNGASRFQTTDVEQIAWAAAEVAEQEAAGVFNIADTDSPSVIEIGHATADYLDKEVQFIGVEGASLVGRTPWSIPGTFAVDGTKAQRLGEEQAFDYADHCGPALDWLRDLNPADWRTAFPALAAYPWDLFDYEAEDRFFDERS